MTIPQVKAVVGTTTYQGNALVGGQIIRVENGFDTATVTFADRKCINRATITKGAAISIYFKDYQETAWTTVFTGVIRFLREETNPTEILTAKCDGAGYPFLNMLCAREYGSQAQASDVAGTLMDSIQEILVDANDGIITKYTEHVLGSTNDSGYTFTATIEPIAGEIKYVYYPYKPCSKAIEDLCDIVTAIKAGGAGPHWIVLPTSEFLLTTVGAHSVIVAAAGWPTYYGGTALLSTLIQGIDFVQNSFESLEKDANYVAYYGQWRRPGNGDFWTEENVVLWGHTGGGVLDLLDSHTAIVGTHSLVCDLISAGGYFWYPLAQNAAWNFSVFDRNHIPTLNFYARRSDTLTAVNVTLNEDEANYWNYNFISTMTSPNEWYHYSIPFGPFWTVLEGSYWEKVGAPVWNAIDYVKFGVSYTAGADFFVDGLYFGDVPICRIAREQYPGEGGTLGQTANPVKMKIIVDDVGKDDSLLATDDSGVMAQIAYAELLKGRTTPMIGTFTTKMLKDALPGELFHIHARPNSLGAFQVHGDFRTTKLTHIWDKQGFWTHYDVTSDVVNHSARSRWTDLNRVLEDARPEFQDRQASNIKAGTVDVSAVTFEHEYI
jgi:hypothetical protein